MYVPTGLSTYSPLQDFFHRFLLILILIQCGFIFPYNVKFSKSKGISDKFSDSMSVVNDLERFFPRSRWCLQNGSCRLQNGNLDSSKFINHPETDTGMLNLAFLLSLLLKLLTLLSHILRRNDANSFCNPVRDNNY